MSSSQSAKRISSRRGSQLVKYLERFGFDEDSKGITAFYIIQTPNNLPLAFFSLKCGLLFTPSRIDIEKNEADESQHIIDFLNEGRNANNPDNVAFYQTVDDLAVKNNCSSEEMSLNIKRQAERRKIRALSYKSLYHRDELTEADKPIFRVHITYPAVEIVHFCTNDGAKEYWENLNIGHPLGEVLFWSFIVDKLLNIQKIAGCQYVYLFAADSSDDRTLINYYNVSLKFLSHKTIGTSKPRYDYCCEFLMQDINLLETHKRNYFDNFNLDEEVEII